MGNFFLALNVRTKLRCLCDLCYSYSKCWLKSNYVSLQYIVMPCYEYCASFVWNTLYCLVYLQNNFGSYSCVIMLFHIFFFIWRRLKRFLQDEIVRDIVGSAAAHHELEAEFSRLVEDRDILRSVFPSGNSKVIIGHRCLHW